MSLSLSEGKRREPAGLFALLAANLLFAGGCIFLWALMSLFLAAPMRWATAQGLGPRPELLDYPFVLLWLLPVAGACGAWIAQNEQRPKLACLLAAFPLLVFALVAGWFYLAPARWH